MASKHRFLDRAYAFDEDSGAADSRQLYDEWATAYDDELVGEQGYAMPQRCAKALARFASPAATRVLDVGCGTGLSGQALAAAGFTAIDGCDLSPAMLERAELTGLYGRLFEADLTKPPLDVEDESYAAIAAVGVYAFGHLHPDTTETILRALSPSGVLAIGVNDHYYVDGGLAAKIETLKTAGTVTRLLTEHGEHLPAKGVGGWVVVLRKHESSTQRG